MSIIYMGGHITHGNKSYLGNLGPMTDLGVRGPRIKTSLVFYQPGVLGSHLYNMS